MAESLEFGDVNVEEEVEALMSARALSGAAAGVASLSRSEVRWRPDNPATAEVVVKISAITGA
jgi:hypothetical protein